MEKRTVLKDFRERQKLTQLEMAEKLGISLVQYQFVELGRRNPSIKLLKRFKNIFPTANIEKIFLD